MTKIASKTKSLKEILAKCKPYLILLIQLGFHYADIITDILMVNYDYNIYKYEDKR